MVTPSLPLHVLQGCTQFVGNEVVEYLYNIGAIGMAFATFEVGPNYYVSEHQNANISM